MQTKLEREVRFLKIYAVVSTVVFAVLLLAGFTKSKMDKTRFAEIDVERINVIEKDGKLDLVISNSERMPPVVINGKVMKSGSGPRGAGMLFYNGKGDENGGLGFGSETSADGKYSANAQLMFDQYNQDQTVGIVYQDRNGNRVAGLRVWDRADMPLDQVFSRIENLPPAEKDAAAKKLAAEGLVGAGRVFVGKLPDKSAQMVLSDAKGKPRLTISVDAAGAARITFLDENGKATYSLPPSEEKK